MVYNQTKGEFKEDIKLSKAILEGIINKEVIGYRAPSFSITKDSLWAIDILNECGFKYDSSIFPTSFHNRYGLSGINNRTITFKNGMIEFPISTFKVSRLRLPLGGGGYFRLFPYSYFNLVFNKLNLRGESFVFYLHPWELDEGQPRVNVSLSYRFRHYINIKHTENKLKRLLQNFKFQPFRDAINKK